MEEGRRRVYNIFNCPSIQILLNVIVPGSFEIHLNRIRNPELALEETTMNLVIALARACSFYDQEEIETFLSEKIDHLLIIT